MVIARVTGRLKDPGVELLVLSVTATENVASMAVTGGVPASTPAALRPSHAGKPVADHLYPMPEPPKAANVWL